MFTFLYKTLFIFLLFFFFTFSQNSLEEAVKKTTKKEAKKATKKTTKTLAEALENAIEGNLPIFTHYVRGKLKTFTNKSYKPEKKESIFFLARKKKALTLKLSDLKQNPKNKKEYAFFYKLPYSFADKIKKDKITIRVILDEAMLGAKEILVEDIKTNRNRRQSHGFIELKGNPEIEKIFIWIIKEKQTIEERTIELINKRFKPEIIYASGDSQKNITKNIGLKKGEYGFKVNWFTDHPNITEDGIVSRLDDLDSIGEMIAKVTKDIVKTNIVNNNKKIETNQVVALFSFTNLVVKGKIKTSGVLDIFGEVIGLEGSGIIYDRNAGVIVNQAKKLTQKTGEEVIQKIYLNEMNYESAFPFSSKGKVYFSPNKSPIRNMTRLSSPYPEGIIDATFLNLKFYEYSPYNEVPVAGGNAFDDSVVSLGVSGADYSIRFSLKKKAKKFVCTLGAHQSTVAVLNQLFTAFGSSYWGNEFNRGYYNIGRSYEWLLKIAQEANRLQPSKFPPVSKAGSSSSRGWNIGARVGKSLPPIHNTYQDKLNFVNEWNTSAKFTDYTKFSVKIFDDGGQVIWESGEMTQGKTKTIDLNVEKLEQITITVFALDRGEMQHKAFKSIDELTPRDLIIRDKRLPSDLMLRDKNGIHNEGLLREDTVGDFVIWGDAYIEYIQQEKDGTINQPPKLWGN